HTGLFAATWFQVAVIQFEILLGIWLLSGWNPLACWFVTCATFLGFAAINFHSIYTGQTSCNCFGAIQVNPWYAVALDMAVLFSLFAARPNFTTRGYRSAPRLQAILSAGGLAIPIFLVLGLLAAVSFAAFGSPEAALAYLRGEHISVNPRVINVGSGHP